MLSNIEMREELSCAFVDYALQYQLNTPVYPDKFISLLECNIGMINPMNKQEELQPHNPLIVALGDSVTAGHFETLIKKDMVYFVQNLKQAYIEQFKHMLQEKCGISSVNIVNSGLAGDNIKSMGLRLKRDVLQYNPDLVLINASLNWSIHQGDTDLYEYHLRKIIEEIQKNSKAEIVLLTPNMAIESENDMCLGERVEIIRKLTKVYEICLVDVYAVWEKFVRERQLNVKELLANKENHPTAIGHKVYAILLMKLFSSLKQAEWMMIPKISKT